jgi:hypothetical protein
MSHLKDGIIFKKVVSQMQSMYSFKSLDGALPYEKEIILKHGVDKIEEFIKKISLNNFDLEDMTKFVLYIHEPKEREVILHELSIQFAHKLYQDWDDLRYEIAKMFSPDAVIGFYKDYDEKRDINWIEKAYEDKTRTSTAQNLAIFCQNISTILIYKQILENLENRDFICGYFEDFDPEMKQKILKNTKNKLHEISSQFGKELKEEVKNNFIEELEDLIAHFDAQTDKITAKLLKLMASSKQTVFLAKNNYQEYCDFIIDTIRYYFILKAKFAPAVNLKIWSQLSHFKEPDFANIFNKNIDLYKLSFIRYDQFFTYSVQYCARQRNFNVESILQLFRFFFQKTGNGLKVLDDKYF